MPSRVQAIETVFDGYRFRSRLEARWAVFFDHLGIDYGYEIEGFDLDGVKYLPDFYLPSLNCWVEIKGAKPTEDEDDKARRLAVTTGKTTYIFFGDVGSFCVDDGAPGFLSKEVDSAYKYWTNGVWDNYHAWCQCPECGRLSIQYEARVERGGCGCFDHQTNNPFSPKLKAAYDVARSYRFGGAGSIA